MNKGERMEEYLRHFFLTNNYFVVRGSKLKHDTVDITDIDLFLYYKSSLVSRERINVDIKNKKTPQAFERILWAKGLQSILNFDKAIVATTDKKPEVKQFALLHGITLIDGDFLADLERHKQFNTNRFTEEELYELITSDRYDKLTGNWIDRIEASKSILLNNMDFSGANVFLANVSYFLKESIAQAKDYQIALRISYLMISYFLVTLDFIFRDFATLPLEKQKKILDEGIRFGKGGSTGINDMIEQASAFIDYVFPHSEGMQHELRKKVETSYKSVRADIVSEYCIMNATSWFDLAREFELLSFSKEFIDVKNLSFDMKSMMHMLFDYFNIPRKHFL